jgi:hypothetical protein
MSPWVGTLERGTRLGCEGRSRGAGCRVEGFGEFHGNVAEDGRRKVSRLLDGGATSTWGVGVTSCEHREYFGLQGWNEGDGSGIDDR